MSVIAVNTKPTEGGQFITRWKWKTNPNSRPTVGEVQVTLDESHTVEREAIAEIQALYHLLEVRKIQGENRLGTDLRICLSSSIVRKALLKGALKNTGEGKAVHAGVATGASFLATKYFEASYEVQRWKEEEAKVIEFVVQTHVGPQFSRVELPCKLLDAHVYITRHAMNRWVARICESLDRYTENDLGHLPDARWSQAWRWFANVLMHKGLLRADLLPEVAQRYQKRYGDDCAYLHFSDAQAVLVMVRGETSYELVTVLRTNPHTPILEQERVMAGQNMRIGRVVVPAKR